MPESARPITRQVLRDFVEDDLPDAEKAAVEKAVRKDPAVAELLKDVRDELDRGEHSVGAIWRRERLSCPTREQLGQHLLGATPPDLGDYVEFHLETVGCPYCLANLEDLKGLQKKAKPASKPAAGKKWRRGRNSRLLQIEVHFPALGRIRFLIGRRGQLILLRDRRSSGTNERNFVLRGHQLGRVPCRRRPDKRLPALSHFRWV